MLNWLYQRFPTLLLARRNLTRARARTALAMLGIVIGVVAISSLGVFGLAFEQAQLQDFDLGSTIIVRPGEDSSFDSLGQDHVARIESVAGDETVVPMKETRKPVSHLRKSETTSVMGVHDPERFFDARSGFVPESWRSGALVGSSLADRFGITAGETIVVGEETYRVMAVLEPAPEFGVVQRPNDAVFLTPSEFESDRYQQVTVKTDTPLEAGSTAETLRTRLNGRKELFSVQDFSQYIEQFERQAAQINRFLLGIGGISLLVAGVSILNVMLMSVIERREEIGVLRAVGYHRFGILRMLLAEAALLGVVGAVVGSLLSVLMGMAINQVMLGAPFAFTAQSYQYLLVGFVFGLGAALVSGLYPAWKAANAKPVEALRD